MTRLAPVLLLLVSCFAVAEEPRPGLYKTSVSVSGSDFSIPPMIQENCMTAEDMKPDHFNELNNCTTSGRSMTDGRITANFACTESGMTIDIEMTGTYDAEGMVIENVAKMAGTTLSTTLIEVKRVGDC